MRRIHIHHLHSVKRPGQKTNLPRLLVKWLCLTGSVLFAAWAIEGIRVDGILDAMLAAGVLGFLNLALRPLLLILTLPINVLTLGLFTLVVNAVILKTASLVVPGFVVKGFWAAVGGSLLISIANWVLHGIMGKQPTIPYSGKGGPAGPFAEEETIDLGKRGGKWQ